MSVIPVWPLKSPRLSPRKQFGSLMTAIYHRLRIGPIILLMILNWKEGEGFFFNADGVPPVGQEGLLGYWKLDEISGAVAHNSVANGADGRLSNNPIWLNDGERGRVLQFDGIDDFLVAGSATIPRMTTSNDFTWSFWAYSNEGRNNNVILGNRYSPTGVDYSPREFIKFTTSAFEFHRNGRGEDIDYSSIPLRRWIHHAVVKKGTQLTYYRQGRLSDTRSITQGLRNAQPFYFGGDRTVENWSGRLDDVAIWEKALPPSSISGLADGSLTPDSAPFPTAGRSREPKWNQIQQLIISEKNSIIWATNNKQRWS